MNNVPIGYFLGYKCDICDSSIYFPICSNLENDHFEKLAFSIYSVKLDKKVKLCFDCNKLKESMEKKKSFKREKVLINKIKIKHSDYLKSIYLGLIEDKLVI